MKSFGLLLSCFIIFFTVNISNALETLPSLKNFIIPSKEDEKLVDIYFDKKEYAKAYPIYLKLAAISDKYAQYRISTMYLQGLGREQSFVNAYAWAHVAKENNNPDFVAYFKKLDDVVHPEDKAIVKKAANDIFSEYGNNNIAKQFLRRFEKEFPKCTGSRFKRNSSSCERIKVACSYTGSWGDTKVNGHLFPKTCGEFAAKIRPKNLRNMKNDLLFLTKYIQGDIKKTTVTIEQDDK